MRLLVISHRVPYPPNKGEKLRSYYQLEQLNKNGAELVVAAPYESEAELQYFQGLENNLGIKTLSAKLPHKLQRYVGGFIKGQSLSEANFYSQELQQYINQAHAEHPFDAVLCTASSMAPYCLHWPIKKLMDFMDVDSDKWAQYQSNSPWPMSWVYAREQQKIAQLEKAIQQQFDHCFLISQKEVDLFARQLPINNVHVLANGIDFSGFYPSPSGIRADIQTNPAFLFVGVMDYKPNVDAVLWFAENVWPVIYREAPEASFSIVGMNPSPEVQALAKQPGIIVTGMVDSVLPYFHQADIFVAPFMMARGVQNKVLQAFSCGLPVICTPMGAEGIACEEEVHYLQASNGEGFIQCAQQLIAEPQLRQQLSEAASQLIQQNYAWPSVLKPLTQLLGVSHAAH